MNLCVTLSELREKVTENAPSRVLPEEKVKLRCEKIQSTQWIEAGSSGSVGKSSMPTSPPLARGELYYIAHQFNNDSHLSEWLTAASDWIWRVSCSCRKKSKTWSEKKSAQSNFNLSKPRLNLKFNVIVTLSVSLILLYFWTASQLLLFCCCGGP